MNKMNNDNRPARQLLEERLHNLNSQPFVNELSVKEYASEIILLVINAIGASLDSELTTEQADQVVEHHLELRFRCSEV